MLEKLAAKDKELVMSADMLKHSERAMKNLVDNQKEQDGLEETIFQAIKKEEARAKYDKGTPVTRANEIASRWSVFRLIT